MNANSRLALKLALLVALMTGVAFASVPLYNLFCRVTGFDGTTQKAEALPAYQRDEEVTVLFTSDVDPRLPWTFTPEIKSIKVKLGAAGHGVYRVKNTSDKPVVGISSYNVLPEKAGLYFQKIKCFCFEKHTLQAGEEKEFPVLFFIDPSIADNADTKNVKTITLHYTYFEAKD